MLRLVVHTATNLALLDDLRRNVAVKTFHITLNSPLVLPHLRIKLLLQRSLVRVEPLMTVRRNLLDHVLVVHTDLVPKRLINHVLDIVAECLRWSRASTRSFCQLPSRLNFAPVTTRSVSSLLSPSMPFAVADVPSCSSPCPPLRRSKSRSRHVERDLDLRKPTRSRLSRRRLKLPKDVAMQRRLHVVSLPWTMTRCWLSACGEKTCDFFVGTVVFHGTGDIMTPPTLSMHRVSGAMSRRMTLYSSRQSPQQ